MRALENPLAIVLLALGLQACASETEVQAGPHGANVLVDAGDASALEPDYTQEELEAIASTAEFQANLEPFRDAPAPDRTLYVPMRDGVRIAIDVFFPPGFDPDRDKAPVAYSETWYFRAREATATAVDLYRNAGFVFVIADPRGFGASFGSQAGYLTDEQRDDQREMIGWLARQGWSNGKVAATGISASAMLAEAMLGSGAEALEAGIVRETEMDQYSENLLPGGVPNTNIQDMIAEVLWMNRAEPCLADDAACAEYQLTAVDGDEDLSLLRMALLEHRGNVDPDALKSIVYRDDRIGASGIDAVSPRDHVADVARHAVPARVVASWLDGATAQAALARYAALPGVPMQLSLGSWTHQGGLNADPFEREAFSPAETPAAKSFGADIEFLQKTLAGETIERRIDYHVLGTGVWKSTKVWPPHGVRQRTLYLSETGLSEHGPKQHGAREYTVDAHSSSGAGMNRWASQMNHPVYFGDRRFAPGTRASFESRALESAQELVGAPELCLMLRSDQTDGAVYAYLEDVAPDGRITYLSEGVLRLIHRKTGSGGCDAAAGTERSFERADAAAVVPGERMEIELPLLPVAAKIERGHKLRLSLAGADEGTFPLLTEVPPTWSIEWGGEHGSSLRVPLRPWN